MNYIHDTLIRPKYTYHDYYYQHFIKETPTLRLNEVKLYGRRLVCFVYMCDVDDGKWKKEEETWQSHYREQFFINFIVFVSNISCAYIHTITMTP